MPDDAANATVLLMSWSPGDDVVPPLLGDWDSGEGMRHIHYFDMADLVMCMFSGESPMYSPTAVKVEEVPVEEYSGCPAHGGKEWPAQFPCPLTDDPEYGE